MHPHDSPHAPPLPDRYDELSRRADEQAWADATTSEIRKESIPVLFLPIIEDLPQERQQSRQKMATLGHRQFCQLIHDLLTEMDHRRFAGASVLRPCSRRPSVPGNANPELSLIDECREVVVAVDDAGGSGLSMAEDRLVDVVTRLERRVQTLESLVGDLSEERIALHATQHEQAREIAALKAMVCTTDTTPLPTDDGAAHEDTAVLREAGSMLSGQAAIDDPDVWAKRMSDQTNLATASLQGVFKAAKQGDKKETADCVKNLSAEVAVFEEILKVVAPHQSTSALRETVTLLESTLLSCTNREIMLKAYAVANEISALVDTL